MGKEHLIRRGEKETRRAHEYEMAVREAKQTQKMHDAEQERRNRDEGKGPDTKRTAQSSLSFFGLFGRPAYQTKLYRDGHVEVHQVKRAHPWMHFEKRCLPWYHGFEHRFYGFVTGHNGRRSRGRSLNDLAVRERARERKRKLKELERFGHAMRAKHRAY